MIYQVKGVKGLWRGPLTDLAEVRKTLGKGKIAVVNLIKGDVTIEWDEALNDGMLFFHEPMSEFARPGSDRLRFWAFIIKSLLDLGYSVFVHCLHGEDRTGYVIAAFRMLIQKWSFKDAYQEAKDYGHKWWFAPYLLFWPRSLRELC